MVGHRTIGGLSYIFIALDCNLTFMIQTAILKNNVPTG